MKAAVVAEDSAVSAEYLFHLDALPERVSFSRRIEISGWLFHRHGKPVHGLRGVVKPASRNPAQTSCAISMMNRLDFEVTKRWTVVI